MKKKIGWIVLIVLAVLLLLVLPGLFMMGGYGRYGGMMGGYGYGGMMNGFGFTSPFGFFGMALMWLIPIGLLVLVVLGVVALVNGLNKPGNTVAPVAERNCSNCGKPAQSGWTACPYCGKPL
jgi:hypothetical protein